MQEELKILRLRYSILQEEELENRENELEELLIVKKEASVRSSFCCILLLAPFLSFLWIQTRLKQSSKTRFLLGVWTALKLKIYSFCMQAGLGEKVH